MWMLSSDNTKLNETTLEQLILMDGHTEFLR